MRKVHLVRRETQPDGSVKEVVVYSGSQKSHMQPILNHKAALGEDVFIREEPHKPRRKRINPLTGKPAGSRTHVNNLYRGT